MIFYVVLMKVVISKPEETEVKERVAVVSHVIEVSVRTWSTRSFWNKFVGSEDWMKNGFLSFFHNFPTFPDYFVNFIE